MTRFWLTLEQGVNFVIRCMGLMRGGEIFVPKIPSMKIIDVAKTLAPESQINFIGIRPGEKIHEVLISEDEARHTVELERMYVITPRHGWGNGDCWPDGQALPDGFRYTSDTNKEWLTEEQLQKLAEEQGLDSDREGQEQSVVADPDRCFPQVACGIASTR